MQSPKEVPRITLETVGVGCSSCYPLAFTLQCSNQLQCMHHHQHHFQPAPLRVHSATHSQQPPERAILSHIDCQCEIMGFKVIQDCLHPCDPRTSGRRDVSSNLLVGCSQDLLVISIVIHLHYVPK